MPKSPFYTRLENRGRLHIEGADRHTFLQGLITNDMGKLSSNTLLYACLLNAQGKFLHDFFVIEGDGFLMLDCEGGERTQDLYKRLMMYHLRADVQITAEDSNDVYAIGGDNTSGLKDPRHPGMGRRSLERPENMEESSFDQWDKLRITHCIPDGSRDLIPASSTMDEARMDQINAIDYSKGCYIGQELTARMHYRGLGKKHLYTLHILDNKTVLEPQSGRQFSYDDKALIDDTGKTVGDIRSSCGDLGIALIKDSALTIVKEEN